MRERIEQLVAAFEASLDDGSFTPESFQQVAADIGALEPISEFDRLAHLTGTVRLFDAILTRLPPGEGAALREQREAIAAVIERKYRFERALRAEPRHRTGGRDQAENWRRHRCRCGRRDRRDQFLAFRRGGRG